MTLFGLKPEVSSRNKKMSGQTRDIGFERKSCSETQEYKLEDGDSSLGLKAEVSLPYM